jgi:hypothetical protein
MKKAGCSKIYKALYGGCLSLKSEVALDDGMVAACSIAADADAVNRVKR